MYLNAGASQRAQGRSPGLGGRGTRRRGVASGAVASLPAGRRRPEAGRSHRTATRRELRWELRLGYIYYLACPGRAGAGGELGWMCLQRTRSGCTSDCGGTCVGIVYVCAVLVSHSRCKHGLPRRNTAVHCASYRGCGLGLLH